VTDQPKKTILVVDDEPEITRMLQLMLEHEGYEVRRAHGAVQGMSLVNEVPDLVLLDIMMPHLNGPELCSYIRRDPRTAHVPVIIYSAVYTEQSVKSAMDAGATRYLHKMVSVEELLRNVRELMIAA
jgi:two-component system response regulator ArlR